MILTITPNPTLDLGGTIDQLIPNEKMYVHDETRFPGGNAINAARIIHRLGVPVQASGFLGGGVGDEICALLKKEKLDHRFIKIQGNTRVNVTVSVKDRRDQTRLSFPGPRISPTEQKKLLQLTTRLKQDSMIILGGSLPPGIRPSWIKQIGKVAAAKGVPFIVDVPGKLLGEAISCSPWLIKPNLTEFQELVGKPVQSRQEVIQEARKLSSRIPLICVSSVEDGAVLITRQAAIFGRIPSIEIKSTVGAGDSMVGAMSTVIWKLWHSKPKIRPQFTPEIAMDVLRWGLAAATATLSQPGTHLGSASQIRGFLNQVVIEELKMES